MMFKKGSKYTRNSIWELYHPGENRPKGGIWDTGYARQDDDLLIFTGDHGTDPTDGKTDHSREYVPLVAYQNNLKGNNIPEQDSFSVIAATISEFFNLESIFYGDSFLEDLLKN